MQKTSPKKTASKKPSTYVASFRRRQKHSGLRRMEVSIKAKDAGLVKSLVSTLCADGPDAERLRQTLRMATLPPKAKTGAEFMALVKNYVPFGDELSFEHDGISRTPFAFE